MAEWASIFLLGSPATNAMSVVSMVAGTPTDHTSFAVGDLISLTLEAGLINAVFADGAVLDGYVPAP